MAERERDEFRIVNLDRLSAIVKGFRGSYRGHGAPTFGLTNGCYDLIHPGHLDMLAEAASLCEKLIVAVDDDELVRRSKGEGRPIRDLATRLAVVAGLRSTTLAIGFGPSVGYSLEDILERVRPDCYICRRYPLPVPERAIAERLQIPVFDLPRHGDYSTTDERDKLDRWLRREAAAPKATS